MAEWQDPENYAIGLFVVLMIVIFLVTSIVVLTRIYLKRMMREQEHLARTVIEHQQSLMWNSLLVQEKERERIASDLHDDLISKLTALMYAIRTNNSQVEPVQVLQDSIRVAREITHDLCPPLLKQTSIDELIESFISPLTETFPIDYYSRIGVCCELKSEIKLQLLRIVQEVINNILKHAKASKITIRLRFTQTSIALVIHDNGIGFDPSRQVQGLGLKNIELRSQLLKGQYRFKSNQKMGTTFQFCLWNDFTSHPV